MLVRKKITRVRVRFRIYCLKSHSLLFLLVGLDPASVYFEGKIGHLSKNDALFVDVIHTSAGHSLARLKLGFAKPLGHVDFYPNGGSWQPGCRWSREYI